jgi:hypothetical protein
MSFEKIISIPGLSGLFRMVAQMRNGGFIVESLADARRIPVSSTQRIIMLKDIAVYTHGDDMPLYKVFKMMKEQDGLAASVSPKAEPADLRTAMKSIVPEFDEERVHASDIRKMFIWYNLVKDVVGSPEAEEVMREVLGEDAPESAPVAEVVAEAAAPAPKATRKKKAEPAAEGAEAEAPVKKPRKTAKSKE